MSVPEMRILRWICSKDGALKLRLSPQLGRGWVESAQSLVTQLIRIPFFAPKDSKEIFKSKIKNWCPIVD